MWWIGAGPGDPELLEAVRTRVAAEFSVPCSVVSPAERPEDAWDARRGQHSSSRILLWLKQRVSKGRVLGLTDADLFIPILTFVFGEAQLNGRVAVVSTARLGGPSGLPGEKGRVAARLQKEAVHELGHTFGLLHCRTGRCAMARSASLRDVDAKKPALCPACRALYLEVSSEIGEPHE